MPAGPLRGSLDPPVSRWPVVPILALLLVSTASSLAAEPRVAKLEWTKVETPDLRLYSSVRGSKTREVARGLELLRAALATLFPLPDEATGDPVTVFLFRSGNDYRPYREAFAADGEAVRGHLVAHPLGDFVAIDAYPREGAWSQPVAFHEMTHAYLENRYPTVPAWLHEGLSEYFSTFQKLGDAVQVGVAHTEHVLGLRRSRFVPWSEILAVEETPRGGVADRYYPQSWLLVHFLRHRREGDPDDVRRYLEALAAGRGPEEAFRETFGLDPAALETPLRAYLNRSRFEMSDLPLDRLPKVPEIVVRPAATEEVLYRLGLSLALGGGAGELAADHFRAAIRRGEPDARAGLAYLLEARDPAAAEAEYQAAVETGADDPLTFHLYGLWLVRRLRGEVPGPDPDLGRTREILARAVDLAPGDPRPRALLGMTWIFDPGDPSPGIAHLEAARRSLPGRPAILFNLAMLQLRAGRIEKARALAEGSLRAADPELALQAEAELERKSLEVAVNRALEDRDPDAARDLVVAARRGADPLRAGELDRWLEEIDAQAARQRDTDLYNRAVGYANFGEWERARELLEEILATGTTPDVLTAARKLLEEAE